MEDGAKKQTKREREREREREKLLSYNILSTGYMHCRKLKEGTYRSCPVCLSRDGVSLLD
jgi:hypothetical protein